MRSGRLVLCAISWTIHIKRFVEPNRGAISFWPAALEVLLPLALGPIEDEERFGTYEGNVGFVGFL